MLNGFGYVGGVLHYLKAFVALLINYIMQTNQYMVSCITTECSICMQRKCITTQCRWDLCTYRLCQRCHFLYGRSKPCPACTRPAAFQRTQLERTCLSLQRKILCRTEMYYVFYYFTAYCFIPAIIVHLMATCGAAVLLVFFPYSCCETYGIFMVNGLVMFTIIGCVACACVERDE